MTVSEAVLPAIRAFLSLMFYLFQNDNEQYMVSFSKSRIAWSSIPENAKAFSSREAAAATLRKVNHYYRGGACWIARLVRD